MKLFGTVLKRIFSVFRITIRRGSAVFFKTRDMEPSPTRDADPPENPPPVAHTLKICPSCGSDNAVKRGFRAKARERVQLYLCRSCRKTFTPQIVKGKHYPIAVVIDGISHYNVGFSLEHACALLRQKWGFDIQPSTPVTLISSRSETAKSTFSTTSRMRPKRNPLSN